MVSFIKAALGSSEQRTSSGQILLDGLWSGYAFRNVKYQNAVFCNKFVLGENTFYPAIAIERIFLAQPYVLVKELANCTLTL